MRDRRTLHVAQSRRIEVDNWSEANHTHASTLQGGALAASAIQTGTLAMERGGLNANVSSLSGIIRISSGVAYGASVSTTALSFLESPEEYSVFRLANATLNGQTTGSKQTIYTVPAGYFLYVDFLIIHSATATMAGLIDMDLGGDATAGDWLQQISLDGFTDTDYWCEVRQPAQAAGPPIAPVMRLVYPGDTVFGAYINTGSTGASLFQVSLYGSLKQ